MLLVVSSGGGLALGVLPLDLRDPCLYLRAILLFLALAFVVMLVPLAGGGGGLVLKCINTTKHAVLHQNGSPSVSACWAPSMRILCFSELSTRMRSPLPIQSKPKPSSSTSRELRDVS